MLPPPLRLLLLAAAIVCSQKPRFSSISLSFISSKGTNNLTPVVRVLAILCIYKGIKCSSPTLASAISTLSPALVFILAVVFSMERLALRSRSTQAKGIGTLVSISGALIVILFKGPTILSPTSIHFLRMPEKVKGGLLLGIGYLLFSMWVILQTHITKTYPDELVLAFLYNLCGTVLEAFVITWNHFCNRLCHEEGICGSYD